MTWYTTDDARRDAAKQAAKANGHEMNEDTQDLVSKAMRRAWQLGQIYWQQADSDSISQHRKADATQATFQQLVDDTRAAIAKATGSQP